MKKYLLSILFLSLSIGIATAQNDNFRRCDTRDLTEAELAADPETAKRIADLEEFTREYVKANENQRSSGTIAYVIPIVFHIIHTNGSDNISKAQCLDAIRMINEDFQKRNADTTIIVSAFKGVAADSQMEFRLAQLDPNGNCTEGITRTYSTLTNSAGENVKDLVRWPRHKYLNVWVVANIASGAGGYAYLPGNASVQGDGIVIRHQQFGQAGTGSTRSLTHEIGHWANLKHCWGGTNTPGVSTNCNDDDLVSDTPNTIGNTSCNLNAISCGTLDNVQNFMEYSFCDRMFTEGQKLRMHATMNSSTADRNNLGTQANLLATGTNDGYVANPCIPVADFTSNASMVCAGAQVNFTDVSWNGDGSSWIWDFPGGTPSSSGLKNPIIEYHTPGVYPVTMTVINAGGQDTKVKQSFITVSPANASINVPFSEGFESLTLPGSNWLIQSSGSTASSKWEISNSTAYSGSKSIRLLNFSGNTIGNINSFILPGIDLRTVTSTNLNFKLSHAVRSTTGTDGLRVYASSDCGKFWSLRFAKTGTALSTGGLVTSNYVPTSTADWRAESTSLASTSISTKPNVMLKFEYTYDNGNNIYIDDINIDGIVGINDQEFQNLDLNIYPNPSSGVSFVNFRLDNTQQIEVSLKDMLGRTVSHVTSDKLDAGDHQYKVEAPESSGVYFLVIKMNERIITRKLVFSNQE